MVTTDARKVVVDSDAVSVDEHITARYTHTTTKVLAGENGQVTVKPESRTFTFRTKATVPKTGYVTSFDAEPLKNNGTRDVLCKSVQK